MKKWCAVLLTLCLLAVWMPAWAQETREGTIVLEGTEEKITEQLWTDEQGFSLWYDVENMLCQPGEAGGCEIIPLEESAREMVSLYVARYQGDPDALEELESGLKADGWQIMANAEEVLDGYPCQVISAEREEVSLGLWLVKSGTDTYCLTFQCAQEALEGWGVRFSHVMHSFKVLPQAVSVRDLEPGTDTQLTVEADGQPIELRFEQALYGVSVSRVQYDHETDRYSVGEVLYTANKQEAGSTLTLQTMIPEIVPNLLVSGVTANGSLVRKLVSWSGLDGSTLLVDGNFAQVSEQEALGILYAALGEADGQTGNVFSYHYEGLVEQAGESWYWFRLSWLVQSEEEQHVSFLNDLMVDVYSGEVLIAVQENGEWTTLPLQD